VGTRVSEEDDLKVRDGVLRSRRSNKYEGQGYLKVRRRILK